MSRYMLGFVVGSVALAAGCGLGVMLAPASGAEIRRRLAWRLDEGQHALARNLERLKERTA